MINSEWMAGMSIAKARSTFCPQLLRSLDYLSCLSTLFREAT
jgi:hypothetical protein